MGRPAKEKLSPKLSLLIQKRCRDALDAALKADERRYLPRKAPDGRLRRVQVTLQRALDEYGAKYAMRAESLRLALHDQDHPLSVDRAQRLLDTLRDADVIGVGVFAQLSAEIRHLDEPCFLIGDPMPRVLAEMRERHPRLSKTVLRDIKEALNTALKALTLPLSEEHRKVLPGLPVHRGSDVYTLSKIDGATALLTPKEDELEPLQVSERPNTIEWMKPFMAPSMRVTSFRIPSGKNRAPKANGGVD
jgi:hypothetical protein